MSDRKDVVREEERHAREGTQPRSNSLQVGGEQRSVAPSQIIKDRITITGR